VPAKRRPPNESTAARIDDALVLVESDRTYNGLPLREYSNMYQRLVRGKSHRLKIQINVSVLHTDPRVSGTLLLRFRWKMAVREPGLFFRDCILGVSGPSEQAVGKQRRPWWQLSSLFAFRKVLNGSFSTIAHKHGLRISVFGGQRIFFFLPVFLDYLIIIL